jgi:hypothetical protein
MSEKMKKKWVNKKLRKMMDRIWNEVECFIGAEAGKLSVRMDTYSKGWEGVARRVYELEQRGPNQIPADVIEMGATCAARWNEQKHDTRVIFQRLQQKDDSSDVLKERVRVLEMQVRSILLASAPTRPVDAPSPSPTVENLYTPSPTDGLED